MAENKKNVLIIACNGLGNSGVPRVICNAIEAGISDYNFDVVVFNDDDYFYPRVKKLGVSIIKFKEPKYNNFFGKVFWHLFKKYAYYKNIFSDILAKKNYCAIHSFREDDSGPIFKLAIKSGIGKRIWHQNTITAPKKWYLRLLKQFNSLITKKYSTAFVGVSELTCEKTFPEKNYLIIHNGYDDKTFNNKIPCLLNSEQLSITHVATFSSNKNQLFSIELLQHLISLYPNSVLNIVGKENEAGYLERIKERVAKLGLEKHVNFFDGDSNIANIFSYTSYTILPSLSEGAPLTTVESQASGIKAFVSNAIPKEMNCGGLTFLDLSKGPQTWAEAIYNEFLKDKNSRNIFNMKEFSNETFKQSILLLYQD